MAMADHKESHDSSSGLLQKSQKIVKQLIWVAGGFHGAPFNVARQKCLFCLAPRIPWIFHGFLWILGPPKPSLSLGTNSKKVKVGIPFR